MNPYYSPYDRDGNIVEHPPIKEGQSIHQERYYVGNPLYNSTVGSVLKEEYLNVRNNIYAEYYWTKSLKTSLRFGMALKKTAGDEFYPASHTKFRNYTSEDLLLRRGSYQVNEGEGKTLSGDLNITYTKSFNDDKHFLLFNVGGEIYENSFEEDIYKAEGFPSESMNSIIFAKQYLQNSKPGGFERTNREIGALGIFNYAYDDKYLIDASVRTTGSSQYGANRRWGTFWSTGLGWNVHNENWFKNSEVLQKLKFRGSIGTTGSQPPAAYAGVAAYDYILDRTYSGLFGLQLIGMRNDDLLWQMKFDKNIGVDFEIFKHRLMITFDLYHATTENSIIYNTLPPSTGFRTVNENVGKVINQGYELWITYQIWAKPKERSFLNLTLTAAHNENRIEELSDAMNYYNSLVEANFEGDDRLTTMGPLRKYYEGASLSSIWAMKTDGIDPVTGNEIFVTKNGTRTYEYIASEQQIFGDELPDLQGSILLRFQYKGFGLNLGLDYLYGGQMYNYTLAQKVEGYDIKYNVDRRVLTGAWMRPGDIRPYARNSDMIRYRFDDDNNYVYSVRGSNPTERFVFDRNELRLSTINISYDFWKHNFIKKMGLERLKLVLYANNIHTWSSVEIERGTNYPFSRTFNFAVSAAF